MPRSFPRAERVEQLARHILAEAISEMKDPRLGFVTLTAVKMSPDMRRARVFISVMGDEAAREASMETIHGATPYLRSVLGSQVRLRYLPELEVVEDTVAADSARLENLLRDLGVSKEPEVAALDEPLDEPSSSEKET